MNRVLIRQQKYNELSKKLEFHREVEFKANRKTMSEAVDQGGGMHDNASYENAASNEKVILSKISELENILANAQIIHDHEINTDVVGLGTQIKVLDIETDEEKEFIIVGAYETDPNKNYISYLAPLAQGFIGKKVDEIAEIKLPIRIVRYEIISIERANIFM